MYTYPLCPEAPPPGPESDEAVDFQPPPPPPEPAEPNCLVVFGVVGAANGVLLP